MGRRAPEAGSAPLVRTDATAVDAATRPRIALDAMGGDAAPAAVVDGAVRAHVRDGIDVVLVGRPDAVAAALAATGAPDALPVVAATDVVAMDEDPTLAIRSKPASSIRVATGLHASGEAAAVVSAGSTGATLAAALLDLGRLPGVRRPAVGAAIPLAGGGTAVLVDAGASADVQAEVLPGYARLGAAYVTAQGVTRPRIGLLNVGVETGKGNALTRTAHDLMATVDGFVGNVEPAAILDGAADVVVSDGFTGNIFLKTLEAAGRQQEASRASGAAVLLGVAGEVFVAHGAADAAAITAALRAAAAAARSGLHRAVAEGLAAQPPAFVPTAGPSPGTGA